jgi:Fe-S oxidoreductase
MRLKRLGPSIIPTEVVVPLDELAAVLEEIDGKVDQPFILEGMVGKGDLVTLLGFIPHDQRTFAFNLAFALSLTVIQIAKRHGGSAYSTGAYFRREAPSVLGEDRVKTLAEYKQQVDPTGVMNPGKVLGSGAIDALMGTASAMEPVARVFANRAKAKTGDLADLTKEKNGIPGDVAFMAYACARCGYCVPTCEQFTGRGWESHSPRGKYAFLREVIEGREKWDRQQVDTFLVCTTCEVCNTRCQLQLPVEHNWMEMRNQLVGVEQRGTFPPFEMMAASLRGERDIWASKAEHRADWVPEDMKTKIKDTGDVLYFAGCTASFVNTDVAEASIRLLDEAGVEFTYMGSDEACCGIPMKVAGKWDLFEEIFEHNVAEARKRGAKTIVTSCPACGLIWKEMYANIAAQRGEEYEFEVKHYSEIVAEAIADGRIDFTESAGTEKVTFHDSCHAGRAQGLYEAPRAMLEALPDTEVVEMEHSREEGLCCGSVLTLVGEKPVAPILGGHRLQEAVDAGAGTVVALCPCCQVQLRDSNAQNEMGLEITDLARFTAKGLGYDIEDMTDNSLYMWSYFDKFIDLMEPENMAALMSRIFPQMMDAMPVGMKPMMKSMKYVPGGLAMMSGMMPVLFPRLAPNVLPKVMPDMITAVEEHIGEMPEDMADLMPDLLPKTMESLMPTYLPELIPYLTPRMIDYIKTDM